MHARHQLETMGAGRECHIPVRDPRRKHGTDRNNRSCHASCRSHRSSRPIARRRLPQTRSIQSESDHPLKQGRWKSMLLTFPSNDCLIERIVAQWTHRHSRRDIPGRQRTMTMKLRLSITLLLLVSCRVGQAQTDAAGAPFVPEPILPGGIVLSLLSDGIASFETRTNSRGRTLQHGPQEQIRKDVDGHQYPQSVNRSASGGGRATQTLVRRSSSLRAEDIRSFGSVLKEAISRRSSKTTVSRRSSCAIVCGSTVTSRRPTP